MSKQQKDNSGVLFVNHERKTDKHPSMKGSCRVDGFDYWLSAWTNNSEEGGKYLSLSFKPKERKSIQEKIEDDIC